MYKSMCIFSMTDCLNEFRYISHIHCFSRVCTNIWRFRWLAFTTCLPQTEHLWFLSPVCNLTWFARVLAYPNQQNGMCTQRRLRSDWASDPIWSESSLCTQWVAKESNLFQADSDGSDQTGRMSHAILLVLSCSGSFARVLACPNPFPQITQV